MRDITKYDREVIIAALKEGYKTFWSDQIKELIKRKRKEKGLK